MQKLKIICLNVWQGGLLWDNLVSFLKSEQPDILMLQEVMESEKLGSNPRFHTLDELAKILPFPFRSYAPALRLLKEDQTLNKAGYMKEGGAVLPGPTLIGNAIVSKYPLRGAAHWFFDIPFSENVGLEYMKYERVPRNLQYAAADINGKALHIFNAQGIWGNQDGKDNDRRLGFSDLIIEKIKDRASLQTASGRDRDKNLSAHEEAPQGVPLGTSRTPRHRDGEFLSDPSVVGRFRDCGVIPSEPMTSHMVSEALPGAPKNGQTTRLGGGLQGGSGSPGILGGDFNVNEGTQSINKISKVYTDIFKGERRTSFNMKRKPPGSGYQTAVVDFIFTSPDVRVLSHRSPAADVSDHLPLICEIEL